MGVNGDALVESAGLTDAGIEAGFLRTHSGRATARRSLARRAIGDEEASRTAVLGRIHLSGRSKSIAGIG